jgi:hypothetical protein
MRTLPSPPEGYFQKRRTPEAGDLPGQSTKGLQKQYHGILAVQGESLVHPWGREAARLADEFLKTGRSIHREAFERQMGGILVQMRSASL